MKRLILVGGTMGVGKTAACRELARLLARNVFLDGDWCWNMNPFVVSSETCEMVMDNIAHMLGNFLRCSVLDNIIFCWVMHEQTIIDGLISRLPTGDFHVDSFSLICTEQALRTRLAGDIAAGIRTADVIERSVPRLGLYENLNTVKIDTTSLSAVQTAREIERILNLPSFS